MMWNPVMALQQSFIRTKQANHESFKKMMDMRTNSSNNTVFADAEGNIAYYHGNFIPKRNIELDYTSPVDGSKPENDWQGLHEVEENILVVNPNNGWIQNCNSTPFTSAGDYSPKPENYPKYMTSYPENYRGIHAVSLLKNTDSLTLDKLIDLAYDPYLPGAQVLISGLMEAYKNQPIKNFQIKEIVGLINTWDYKVSANSIAMTLNQYYFNQYYRSGLIKKNRRDMISIINYMGDESPLQERREILEKAVNQLIDDFGTWKVEWGEYNRYQRINGDIVQKFNDSLKSTPIGMASGYWGALASFGTRKGENTKRIYGVGGNSFVGVVEFGEKVKAKTLLAGGQSGDPASPHFDDQVLPYANAKFKTVAYYKEDVIKRAISKYKPGEDPQ